MRREFCEYADMYIGDMADEEVEECGFLDCDLGCPGCPYYCIVDDANNSVISS